MKIGLGISELWRVENLPHWLGPLLYNSLYYRTSRDYDADYAVGKFYTSANSICNHSTFSPVPYLKNSHFASEISKLFLLETYCFPLISYSCAALNYNNKQLNRINVCWNNAYRKIFRMNVWESVKELQLLCERLDFKHIYNMKKLLFLHKLIINNSVLKAC